LGFFSKWVGKIERNPLNLERIREKMKRVILRNNPRNLLLYRLRFQPSHLKKEKPLDKIYG